MFISQSIYVDNILSKFGMKEANPVCVPADVNVHMLPADENNASGINVPYREAIGSLMFLAIVTRPDIAYSVNVLSRFCNNHDFNHWRAVKRVFA